MAGQIAARSLSLAEVFRMTESEAETAFRKIRWTDTQGEHVRPHCGGLDAYCSRRPSGLLRFRCKACRKDFSITSGTLFAAHKAPFRAYLAAIAVYTNEVKGKNALALSRDLGMSHKAFWIMLHKRREAMAAEFKGRVVGGEGKTAEVDGAYFGGYVKPANRGKPQRSSQAGEPVRQASIASYHPRARRQFASGSLQVRRSGPFVDQVPGCQGNDCECG
jgi:transposase-like protein